MSQRILVFTIAMTFAVIFQACSGSGAVMNADGVKEYSKNYEEMKKIVESAIGDSNINIDFVSESESKDKMTLTLSRSGYMEAERVQQEQGEARIIKVDQNNTRVEIDNPDYHFSVPEHQKEDYQRVIFLRIEDIMERG